MPIKPLDSGHQLLIDITRLMVAAEDSGDYISAQILERATKSIWEHRELTLALKDANELLTDISSAQEQTAHSWKAKSWTLQHANKLELPA